MPENVLALEIYRRLPTRQVREGQHEKTVRDLDIRTIEILAQWFGIDDKLTLLRQLEIIDEQLNESWN